MDFGCGPTLNVATLSKHSTIIHGGFSMAIAAFFDIPGATQEMYDEACSKLTGGRPLRARSDWPISGLVSHTAGPSATGWFVLDVWESPEAFERFGAVLLPILQEIGFAEVQPQVFPAYNVVTD